MVDLTAFLPGLSPVQGKAVVARFDGGRLSTGHASCHIASIKCCRFGRSRFSRHASTATSKRSVMGGPAKKLPNFASCAAKCPLVSLAVLSASVSQKLIVIVLQVFRSTSIEILLNPFCCLIAGSTESRKTLIASSSLPGCIWIVTALAYMVLLPQ
jgi:hypothetical protein